MTPRRNRKLRRQACRLAGRMGRPCRPRPGNGWMSTAIELIYMDAIRHFDLEKLLTIRGARFMGADFGFGPDRCVETYVRGDTITFIRELFVTPPAKVCPLLAQFPLEITPPTLPPGPMFT